MALAGNLKDISLVNLVQLNCQSGITGRLVVEHGSQVAQVYFVDGTIVHTILGELEGKEAFYELLGWESGQFELEQDVPSPTQTITIHCSDLLLGGLYQLDQRVHAERPARVERPEPHELPDDLGEMFGFEKSKLEEEDDPMAGLQNSLEELSHEVTGFVATAIVGMDGLGIAEYASAAMDIEAINAQMTLLFKLVNTTVDKLGAGAIEDFLLTTDQAYLLIRYLADRNYFLGIAAERSKANLGNMRMFSRLYAKKLSQEMPR